MSEDKETIANQAAEYMKQCGIPNQLHAQLLSEICNLVLIENEKNGAFKSLVPNVRLLDDEIWDRALAIVSMFLRDNYMAKTCETIKMEAGPLPEIDDTDETADQCLDELMQDSEYGLKFRERVNRFIKDIDPISFSNPNVKQNITAKDVYPDIISSDYSEREQSISVPEYDSFDGRFSD
ncbi:hypothetical protein TRFO_31377 [Tritrichomonas foetus]|uniref:LisH domain-containing protein n=1 Tax=Tritrichomonas foetus TaxID=1144522 RepID=A0A1J4JRR1_9EUKA|nr:hypothetical protein TRFO_31377 [Tritrichomonas foetus]|eukprot:OHT01715.1 hypothetical protein TRFO_31377 [Tritrichomonas foetus]